MSTFSSANVLSSTSITCGADGLIDNAVLTPTQIEINGDLAQQTTTYSRTAISSSDPFDIDTTGLSFGGAAGVAGNLLLSQGVFDVPTWLANGASSAYYLAGGASPAWTLFPAMPTAYTIYRGIVSSPSVISASVSFGATLSAIPAITISCNMGTGSTLIVPIGIVGFTGSVGAYTGFTWITGQTGISTIFWQAVVV